MNLISESVIKNTKEKIMFNKITIFILILLFTFNIKLFSLLIYENEIIIGKIICREYYSYNAEDDSVQLENKYYVVFDDPWEIKVLDREMIFYEILIANENMEFINGVDYENNRLRIHCRLNLYLDISNREKLLFRGTFAIFIKNIEIIN